MMKFIVSVLSLSLVCSPYQCFIFAPLTVNRSVVVDIDCGSIQGNLDTKEQTYVFRGIPYAEPPIGHLRWQRPTPTSKKTGNCWNGTLIAKEFGNACFQRDNVNTSKAIGSEDCLYLNVWTPSLKPSSLLPVMFWIHGGSLITGDGNQQHDGYAPTPKLARETNMVYVSINYRLNAFGFIALEWLKEKSPFNTSGNYGFMDMIVGLQWVQQNIRNFGGDPNQVTVFGQSSGGTALVALLASPLCKDLFHKAWLLSASPLMNKTAPDAFKDNEFFIKNSKCTDVDCLYALSPHEVIESVPWDVFPYWQMEDLLGLPIKGQYDGALAVVDGYVLQEAPFEAWVHGHGVDVPVIIGSTAQETDMYPDPANVSSWKWTSGQYEKHVRKVLGNFGDVVAETALRLYPSGLVTPEYQLTTMASDLRVNCGNDYLSLIMASSFSSPVYRYVTTYSPSRPVSFFGYDYLTRYSAHGIDIFAFFGTMNTLMTVPSHEDLEWESNVRREIVEFVKNGQLASKDWKRYPETTALLSVNTTVVDTYHGTECEFWLTNGFFSYSWIN